jgi:hypothetical protein
MIYSRRHDSNNIRVSMMQEEESDMATYVSMVDISEKAHDYQSSEFSGTR